MNYQSSYLSKNIYKHFEIIIYTTISFFIPLFIGHPQLAVGIVVNTMIITTAVRNKNILPVIIAPSLGALSRGMLFGPFTIYLLYMLPFIWTGNYLLARGMKTNTNYIKKLIASSAAKALFLFISAYILYSLNIIPKLFLTAMGIIQLITALGGGIAAYSLLKIKRNYY